MKFVISETSSSIWHYHLREVVDNKYYYGGGAPPALCGKKVAWDTKIPVEVYGHTDNAMPTIWCERCAKLAMVNCL